MLAKKEFKSISSLFAYCTDTYKEKGASPLSAFVIFPLSEATPAQISEIAKNRGMNFSFKKTGEDIYKISLKIKSKLTKFHLITNRDWWLFLSDESSSGLRKVLVESFIGNHLSWALEAAYLDTQQMKWILDDISTSFKSLFITGCKYYQLGITTLQFIANGYHERYESKTLMELEDRANGTISAVKFIFKNEMGKRNKVRILTQSHMILYQGNFIDFYQSIVLPYAEQGLRTKERYSNRERKVETRGVRLYPSKIILSQPFESEEVEKLQQVLVSQYSTSIVYYNPVLIAHSTDRLDGSCFDLYLEDDTIEIVPLTRATSGAFTRLFTTLMKYSPQVKEIRDEKDIVLH
jgi:hypothetical protein